MKLQLAFLVCLAATVRADTTAALPVNGHDVPVTDIGSTTTKPTSRGGDVTVTKPDQTFSAVGDGLDLAVGVQDGKPAVNPGVDVPTVVDSATEAAGSEVNGRKLLAKKGARKLLAGLELSGDGVSAGNDDVGEQANAYGKGDVSEPLPQLSDTHIQPHGVDSTTTVDGQDTTAGAGFNPDCVGEAEGYNEGKACTYANGK